MPELQPPTGPRYHGQAPHYQATLPSEPEPADPWWSESRGAKRDRSAEDDGDFTFRPSKTHRKLSTLGDYEVTLPHRSPPPSYPESADNEVTTSPGSLQHAFKILRGQIESVRPTILWSTLREKDPLAAVHGQLNRFEKLCNHDATLASLKSLREENSVLYQKWLTSETALKRLEREAAQRETDLKSLKEEKNQSEERKKNLSRQLQVIQDRATKAETNLRALQEEKRRWEETGQSLSGQVQSLQEEAAYREKSVRGLELKNGKLENETVTLSRQLETLQDSVSRREEALQDLQEKNARLEDELRARTNTHLDEVNRLKTTNGELERLRISDSEGNRKTVERLRTKSRKQETELGKLRAQADTHLDELSRLKAINDELERQGISDSEKNRKTVEQLKTECKNRDIKLGELRAKLNTHLDELGRLKTDNSELERLRRSDERYRKTVEQMKTEYKKKEVELVEMRATLNTNLDELGRLKAANSELEQLKIIENETHRNKVEQLETKYKKKEMELVEMRATLNTNLDELGRLKTENNELKRLKIIENETHRNKVKQLQTASTTQCNELAQLKAQNKTHVDKIEALTEENVQLNSRVQQQENQIQDLEAGLEEQIAKNEQISRLVTLPNTPGSVTHGTAECEMRNGLEEFLSRTSSPSPAMFIKIERPDPGVADATRTTTTTAAMPIPNTGLVPALWESRTDVEKIGYLGKGTTMILEKVFQTGAQRNHDLVLGFIERLGALSCNAVVPPNSSSSYPEAFSGFKSLNLFNTSTPPLEMKSLQEEFTRLCLLIPCLDDARDQPAAFETMTELITSLMSSDHSFPTPGLAFLEALSSVRLDTKHEHFTPLKGLLAIMICELCRSLECHFPWAPKRRWDIGTILGEAVQDQVAGSPLGLLAAALSDPIGSPGIQQRLAACCGDQFCAFQQLDEYGQENEIGLLCSGGIANFIIINFSKGELTVADRSSAGMPVLVCDPPASTKWDLPVRLCGGRELRIEKAPKNAAVFWLKYAMVDG